MEAPSLANRPNTMIEKSTEILNFRPPGQIIFLILPAEGFVEMSECKSKQRFRIQP